MSGPPILLIGPLLAAAVVFSTRRWSRLSSGLAALLALVLWILTATISLTPTEAGLAPLQTVFVLGRSLTLDDQLRTLLLLVYGLLFVLLLASIWMPQGRDFAALTLVITAPLTAALMVTPFVFGAAFLALAAAGLSLLIQSEQAGSALAGLRWLTVSLLAAALLLVAGWALEADGATVATEVLLFAVSFVTLLVGFPFHIWVAPAMRRARSLVPTVVFGLAQLMVLFFCLRLLRDNQAIHGSRLFLQLSVGAGLATWLAGGALALVSRSLRVLPGYLLLLNTGSVLATLGFSDALGMETATALVVSRILGLLLLGFGLESLPADAIGNGRLGEEKAASPGIARRAPLGAALYVLGALTLIGSPLTVGFPGQYAVLLLVSSLSPWYAVGLVLSVAAAVLGLLRFLAPLALRLKTKSEPVWLPDAAVVVFAALALSLAVLLAIFPQSLLAYAARLAASL